MEQQFKSKKELVFHLFGLGIGKKRVMEEAKITPASYYNYKNQYKKYLIEQQASQKAEEIVKKQQEEEILNNDKGEPVNEVVDIEKLVEDLNKKVKEKNKYLVVDIIVNDGTILEQCGIFEKDEKERMISIQNPEKISSLFQKVPWGSKIVYFQNIYLQGNINVMNVKEYEIKIVEV